MGHVSDFNGMNGCDESDLNQAASELMPVDNFLDLNLNENFMPIYTSFPDDIYRQSSLYASNNLSSFVTSDEDRNGYFDEALELDLFFDSDHNFNIDFDTSGPILENETPIIQNDVPCDFIIEDNANERNGIFNHFEEESHQEDEKVQKISQAVSYNEVNSEENPLNVDCFESALPVETKTYTAETVFNNSESPDVNCDPIPKIIIRLKPESIEQNSCNVESSAPMTIADNVKLGRRRNGSLKVDDSGQSISKKINKHKTHKRKSRHKKRQDVAKEIRNVPAINQNFNGKLQNNTVAFTSKSLFLNQNVTTNQGAIDTKTFLSSSEAKNSLQGQLSSDSSISLNKSSPFVDTDFYACKNEHMFINLKNETAKVEEEVNDKTIHEHTLVDHVDSFQFDFEDANALPPSSINIKKEMGSSVEDILEHIDITLDDGNIPNLNKSLIEDGECSVGNSPSNEIHEEFQNTVKEENKVVDNEPVKNSSATDLIEELNAHNQQVFEEIEISTPELELELNDEKNSTAECPEASHPLQNSANDNATIQSIAVAEHGENDMNSQNHLSANKISSTSTRTVSSFHSINNQNGTAQSRNISNSCSSITSKSSTSHRSYRKRRRSSPSSSSSSDDEKFCNRPVKYDPVTDTYCDEFGRKIRPNELKYYLNSKSSRRDSHSNNGSSSSSLSRSKSPRYRSYHRKHRKSRSNSRSHRRWRHSSSRSRSRSRSHGRKHKGDGERKYRSPSPKHRSKRQHYMEVEENMKAYEERRVMYVGDIPPDYTVEQLKERFGRFGPIQTASIKSKFTNDGSLYIFGFVTFKNRSDVCEAIERGNENPSWPKFDLNFGGRRRFCNGNYTDLDGKVAEAESGWYGHQSSYRQQPVKKEDDFAELLRLEQKRLGMAKK